MQSALFILFAVFTAPDGGKTPSDVAVFGKADTCQLVAGELNQSPRKPKDKAA